MKKLLTRVRNELAKTNEGIKEQYKDFTEKKRAFSHFYKEITESSGVINEIKGLYQRCLNSVSKEYEDLIDCILMDAE